MVGSSAREPGFVLSAVTRFDICELTLEMRCERRVLIRRLCVLPHRATLAAPRQRRQARP